MTMLVMLKADSVFEDVPKKQCSATHGQLMGTCKAKTRDKRRRQNSSCNNEADMLVSAPTAHAPQNCNREQVCFVVVSAEPPKLPLTLIASAQLRRILQYSSCRPAGSFPPDPGAAAAAIASADAASGVEVRR